MATNKEIDIKIQTAIDTANTSKSLKDLKASLKELTSLTVELGDDGGEAFKKAATAAGQLKGKIEDARASMQAVSGDPIENLTASLNLAKTSLNGLDFGQAATGIKLLADNVKGFKPEQLSEGIGMVTNSIVELGKAILSNPILLLASVVILLITKFEELKGAGGFIGEMFGAIGKAVKFLTDGMIKLLDATGLTAIAIQKKAEKTLKALELEKTAIEERYNTEIAMAAAANQSTAKFEGEKLRRIQENAAAALKVYDDQKAAGVQFTKEEKEEHIKRNQDYKAALDQRLIYYAELNQKVKDSQRETDFELRQQRIDAIKNDAQRLAEQQKLDADKLSFETKKEANKRKGDLKESLEGELEIKRTALQKEIYALKGTEEEKLAGTRAIVAKIQDLEKENAAKIADIDKQAEDKITNGQTKAQKERYEAALNRQATYIQGKIALDSDELAKTLENVKATDQQKYQAQDEFLTLSKIRLEEDTKNKIALAKGDATIIKQIKTGAAIEEIKINQRIEANDKDYFEKKKKHQEEYLNYTLDKNIELASLQKEFAVSAKQQLDAEIELLKANNEKKIANDKEALRQRLLDVNLVGAERIQVQKDYDNVEVKNNEETKKRIAKTNKDFVIQEMQEINDLRVQNDQSELDNLKKSGAIKLNQEIALLNKLHADTRKTKEDKWKLDQVTFAGQTEILAEKRRQYEAEELADYQALQAAKLQAASDAINKVAQIASTVTSGLSQINSLANANDNAEFQASSDEKKRILEEQMNAELATVAKGSAAEANIKNKYAKAEIKLDKDLEKTKNELAKKQFERQKALSLVSAIISTAQAVASALTVPPFPLGAALAVVAGAMGAVQIALIANSKFNPTSSGSGSGGGGGGGVSAPSIPSATQTQDIGKTPTYQPAVQERELKYTRVYVTQGDIREQINKVQVLEERATF